MDDALSSSASSPPGDGAPSPLPGDPAPPASAVHDPAPTPTPTPSPAPAGDAIRAAGLRGSAQLQAFLAEVRQLLRRRDAAAATGWALAALLVLALVLPLAALALAEARATALALAASTGLLATLVVVVALVLGGLVPARRWRSDHAVARYVGERTPTTASELRSSVELADALHEGPRRPGAPSQELVAALVDRTAAQVRRLQPAALVPRTPARRAWLGLAGALAVHGGVVAVAPGAVADGWRRVVERPATRFAGASLHATPLVGDLEVTLEPPAYTRRPAATLPNSTGDFRAMPGTQVTLRTTALTEVAAASLLVEFDDPAVEPVRVPVDLDGATLTARFRVADAAHYRFEVQRPDRRRLVEQAARRVELEPDLAPTVTLVAPAEELDVTGLQRLELGIAAEDDHGIAKVELVWTSGGEPQRKPLPLVETPGARARVQAKVQWDLADVELPPGATVSYHVEVTDGDDVRGPNVGSSRAYTLRVFSQRERHEENLARQEELARKLLRLLGGRLTHAAAGGEEDAARDELRRQGAEAVVELGTVATALAKDPQADARLARELEAMRARLDKLAAAEARLAERTGPAARFAAADKALIAELEDDVLLLADWLDRERLETLLDVSDEIAAHRKRLDELLEEFSRTGDPRLAAEIDRELRALERGLAELGQRRAAVAPDVLDQFVHADAVQDHQADGCVAEVRALLAAGKAAEAKDKLAQCATGLDAAAEAMEQALAELRGDRFGAEQQQLDGLMDELSDLAQDQAELAREADALFGRYAERADALMRDLGNEARRELKALVERLKQHVDDIPYYAITPFTAEELDVVSRRLDDLARMIDDGDLAEALAMARQARSGLDTAIAELGMTLEDDQSSVYADTTRYGLELTENAARQADRLIEALERLSPSPEEIMDAADKQALEQLRRRQASVGERADRLAKRARELAPELPGSAGDELSSQVGKARGQMTGAEGRMKAGDPSGARDGARAAAEQLEKAQRRARAAARQQLADGGAGMESEPVRIPGADQYRAPENFREDILEARKRRGPAGYDDLIDRYYEELIR